MASFFSRHGQCTINVDHNIITLNATGPWNKEFFTQLHLELRETISHINNSKYAILVVMHDNALPVKDAIEYHREFIRQGNVTAIAMDLTHCSSAGFTRDIFERIYSNNSFQYLFFYDQTLARQWLNQQLSCERDR